ncbi:MAG: redox-sensing transcriptional repressor Rex [Chloroflexota bacterium]
MMMARADVPEVVVARLPLYLRALEHMAERGHQVVSSLELGAEAGVSSAQIRKDLSYFGEFGKQGLGYDVAYLREQLQRILQLDRCWNMLVVGAGALGHALVNYRAFEGHPYRIVAVFDGDPRKVGQPVGHLAIQPMGALCAAIQALDVTIGILAIPAEAAQGVAEELVSCGIRAILNYAPIHLVLRPGVRVSYLDPVASLQGMSYFL